MFETGSTIAEGYTDRCLVQQSIYANRRYARRLRIYGDVTYKIKLEK
jgi:hypothetical protein